MYQLEFGTSYNSQSYMHSRRDNTYNRSNRVCYQELDTHADDSYTPFGHNSRTVKLPKSTKMSTNSESTIESMKNIVTELEWTKVVNKLEGLESEYNHLISQNTNRDENHFTILNEKIRNLLNKRKNRNDLEVKVPKLTPTIDNNLCNEVSLTDLTHIIRVPPTTTYVPMTSTFYDKGLNVNEWIDTDSPTPQHNTEEETLEEKECSQNHVIPEKFRKKKLPYLDKKIKTGYLKFFDEKNQFGFMNLTTEPFGEVFVFGKEFVKSNIDPSLISVASNNPSVVFRFRVMYYMGKHGESKKAVNIRF